MTREQRIEKQQHLLSRIIAGERQLIPELWQLLRPLTARFARRYINPDRGERLYDEEDLMQESYIALIKALDYWKPERGSFVQAYYWAFQNATRATRGYPNKDAIVRADSLCKPLDDDSETTFQDTIPDGASVQAFDDAEHRAYTRELRQVLDGIATEQLTERQREVISLRYYDQRERQDIAQQMNMTEAEVLQTERKALSVYKQPNNRRRLRPFLPNVYDSGMGAYRRRQMSVVEYYVERLERLEYISDKLRPETREHLRRERIVCELMHRWKGTAPKLYLDNWEQYAAGKTDELLGGEPLGYK